MVKLGTVPIFVLVGLCVVASCAEILPANLPADANTDPLDNILKGLQNAAGNLKSYQCKVEYLFSQPVLESKTLKTGTLSYLKSDSQSKLRIDFDTLSQDEGPQQNYKDCYIFDGLWLTHIDYQIKQVQKRQLAEPNEPIDAFELAKRNFPIIGFGKTEDLKKQFDVNLVGDSNGLIRLQMKVRPDSDYKDDYKSVDVWIEKTAMLPARIEAVSADGDVYEIKFLTPKVNQPIDKNVFEVTIPDGFGQPEIIPLKK
jgi:outer membrane lipoprotein-sorting protein